LVKGFLALGTQYEEEGKMDIAGELLAIDRCLRSPGFRPGDRVLVGGSNDCEGIVIAMRLSISAEGFGNEYEVRLEDEQTEWIDGRLLTFQADH
jgi:hypothetical protein